MITRRKRQIGIVVVVGLLLLVQLVAMQFSSEVNWSGFDFVIAALLLLGAGFGLDLILAKFKNKKQRFIFGAVLLLVFVLIWAELAVGVFGTPFSGS
ncbi:hypothetical protein [Desertivirga arenae]|uniref:hypothetical protein n=1 Tax=Desertivirga arenae TaxID=2810309 RepID=UPI001A96CBA4|nr:hypothetical protein [Pedobacter sp. SYSU D00823]